MKTDIHNKDFLKSKESKKMRLENSIEQNLVQKLNNEDANLDEL